MRHLSIPSWVSKILEETSTEEKIRLIKTGYKDLRKVSNPDVSIIIPAYNEEKGILKTLHSLVLNTTKRSVEIIVVNNNSSDNTYDLVSAASINCVTERKQGITAARNAGLRAAKGAFILNADADAIYPPNWIDAMITPLEKNKKVALTYGRFSFIPTGSTPRFIYFFYEYAAGIIRFYNKLFKEEAVNVYGFNSSFRREQGLAVEGFNHPLGSNEDGWLALKLRNNGFGKLQPVTKQNALVWTTDRRLQLEGGFFKGVDKRVKKVLFPKRSTEARTDL